MSRILDLTGQRYGRLTVVGPYVNKRWTCRCDCGNVKEVFQGSLRRGWTKSCGCLNSEMTAKRNRKHGLTKQNQKPAEFTVWVLMRTRCQDPDASSYPHYGGRGITVCERWASSFEAFMKDMGPRPSESHQLDRIDNNGPYSPENCRWTDKVTQMNNTRVNHLLTLDGTTRTIANWSRATGIRPETIRQRISKLGWDVERALTTPPRQRRNSPPPLPIG